MSSVTFRGLAGQSAFAVPFIADGASDFEVTVAGTPATFTFANGVVTLSSALTVDSDITVSDVAQDAKEAGAATEETLRQLVAHPVAVGYQQLTSLAAASALTVPAGATYAIIQPQAQDVRWRDDGSDPTASVGMLLPVGKELVYDGADLSKLKFIQVAASAKLDVAFYA